MWKMREKSKRKTNEVSIKITLALGPIVQTANVYIPKNVCFFTFILNVMPRRRSQNNYIGIIHKWFTHFIEFFRFAIHVIFIEARRFHAKVPDIVDNRMKSLTPRKWVTSKSSYEIERHHCDRILWPQCTRNQNDTRRTLKIIASECLFPKNF